MEPEVEKRFVRIESLLHSMTERQDRSEALSLKRFERSEQRMERAEQRMDRADQRMDKFDKQLQATRKLVEAGMRMLVRLGTRVDRLAATQDAFLRSLRDGRGGRNGHNGSKRRGS